MARARKAACICSAVTLHALLAIALYAWYFAQEGSLKYHRLCWAYQEKYGLETVITRQDYDEGHRSVDPGFDFDHCKDIVEGILIIAISSVPDFITYAAGVAILLMPRSQVRSGLAGGVCLLQLFGSSAQVAVTAGTVPWIAEQVFPFSILLGGDVPGLVAAAVLQSLVRIVLLACLLVWTASGEPGTAVVGGPLPQGYTLPAMTEGLLTGFQQRLDSMLDSMQRLDSMQQRLDSMQRLDSKQEDKQSFTELGAHPAFAHEEN